MSEIRICQCIQICILIDRARQTYQLLNTQFSIHTMWATECQPKTNSSRYLTVRGRGVFSQEPILNARLAAFQYSSHISLQAPSSHM